MKHATMGGEFDELYTALGMLVVRSSALECELRHLVSWFANSPETDILFDGQSVDWLISSGRAILGEAEGLRSFDLQEVARFDSALVAARELFRVRNLYVHGDWSKKSYLDGCTLRPRNSPEDSRIFYVVRSRLRKGLEEYQAAIVDIENLADKMHGLAVEIDDAVRRGNRLRWAMDSCGMDGYYELDWDRDVVLEALARAGRATHVNTDAG
ncbi:hypothetical protein [Nocardia sp. NPDC003979]